MGGNPGDGWLAQSIIEDVSFPPALADEDDDGRRESFTFPYDVKLLKMYSVMLGKSISEYKSIAIENKYLSKTGDIFKMNLYPLAFGDTRDDLWGSGHHTTTGMPTKTIYKAWCQINRFKNIREWAASGKPKAIICTGISMSHEFLMAFCGFENIHADINRLQSVNVGDREFFWTDINNGSSLLFITPFFGNAYGLNRDDHFIEIGSRIREICSNHHGENWVAAR